MKAFLLSAVVVAIVNYIVADIAGLFLKQVVLVTAIPFLLELMRYVALSFAQRVRGEVPLVLTFGCELAKFVFACVGLFCIASPLDEANASFALLYCVNFCIMQAFGVYACTKKFK